MYFSLILCTVNRTKEVNEFLTSLVNQSYSDFEVIIVDQNKDDRVVQIIAKFSSLTILYLQSELGLSKARNVGLEHAKGSIVSFPDDDCSYPSELLINIHDFFSSNSYDILMGKTIDKASKKIVAGKVNYSSGLLEADNIMGSSTTLFIKKNDIEIYFDEQFGLGAVFNAEEENDLVFRLLKSGMSGYYDPNVNYVYHPPSDLNYNDLLRARQRAIGLGAFIAKHILSFEGIKYFFKYNLIRPLFGSFLYLLQLDFVKTKFYFERFLGVWIGFFKYFKVSNETNI